MTGRLAAVYLLETPLAPERAAEVLAGEQSCGTFVKVKGETAELHARARATVDQIEELEPVAAPSLPSAWLERQRAPGPWRRARVTVSFPIDNIGAYRAVFPRPPHGVAGTRRSTGVADRPLLGTIIKPNVGLSAAATGELVGELCDAGIDFVKDDEVCANPVHAPLAERVREVMARVRRYQDRHGRRVMMAFNITDDIDAMRRHADLIEREGGSAIMVSLNWCGLASVQALRRSTALAIHGHRNGFGMMARHPALGMSFGAYQVLWRLTGIDHLHVHGLDGKFADANDEVIDAARGCLAPVAAGDDGASDAVMPAFSSGQWAGTIPTTFRGLGTGDFIFLSGGGILAHPEGPRAGVDSLRQAWEAARAGIELETYAEGAPALRCALEFFGRKSG